MPGNFGGARVGFFTFWLTPDPAPGAAAEPEPKKNPGSRKTLFMGYFQA